MAKPGWEFSQSARRYRDLANGRFLPKATVVTLRDDVVKAAGQQARTLGQQAATGALSPQEFTDGMRSVLRNAYGAEMIFGRGGVNAMTPSDFGRLGATLKAQYAFLDRFAGELANGTVSEAQAMARSQLYVDGGIKAFEQGQASSWGIVDALPEYPGDRCLGMSRCRCQWDITESDDGVEATWVAEADACEVCAANAEQYNPLSIPADAARDDAEPVRLMTMRRSGLHLVRASA